MNPCSCLHISLFFVLPYLGYFAAIFIGLALGIMGGGGSILTVPVLVYLLGVSPVLSTAYSLFIVCSAALVRAAGYFRRGLVALPTALVFLGPSLVAVFLTRRVLVPTIPHTLFTVGHLLVTKDLLVLVAFALQMVAAAVSMIWRRMPDGAPAAPNYPLVLGIGAVVGTLTGFVGAGGGSLIIPA